MACPPGMVLNPHTFRCISSRGRIARELVRAGDLNAGELRFGVPPPRRVTFKNRNRFRLETEATKKQHDYIPVLFEDVPLKQQQDAPQCPLGYERNPVTHRCIRIGGRTFKRVHPREITEILQIPSSGAAAPVPLSDRRTTLGWITNNCKNTIEPLTGKPLQSLPVDSLQEIVRLHDGTCSTASSLQRHVITEQKRRRIVGIPGIPEIPMNYDDFRVLRDAIRRRNPGFKYVTKEKAVELPAEWKLYVASDQRSGPEYASVGYVDITKGKRTMYGIVYPLDSFRIDLGYLPITSFPGTSCSIQTIVDLLGRLADAKKLVHPDPIHGGWKPIAGFPFTKEQWKTPYSSQRLGRLCRDLAKALSS